MILFFPRIFTLDGTLLWVQGCKVYCISYGTRICAGKPCSKTLHFPLDSPANHVLFERIVKSNAHICKTLISAKLITFITFTSCCFLGMLGVWNCLTTSSLSFVLLPWLCQIILSLLKSSSFRRDLKMQLRYQENLSIFIS